MNEPNRRNRDRVSLSVFGKIRDGDIAASTLDISLSGMALISAERRSPGKFLRVAWCMPGHTWLEADAVVVHARLRNCGDWVLGLRFLHLSRTSQSVILEYVAAERRGAGIGAAPQSKTPAQSRSAPAPGRWHRDVWQILPRDAHELHELYRQALASVSSG
jgi:hypothetical protein